MIGSKAKRLADLEHRLKVKPMRFETPVLRKFISDGGGDPDNWIDPSAGMSNEERVRDMQIGITTIWHDRAIAKRDKCTQGSAEWEEHNSHVARFTRSLKRLSE